MAKNTIQRLKLTKYFTKNEKIIKSTLQQESSTVLTKEERKKLDLQLLKGFKGFVDKSTMVNTIRLQHKIVLAIFSKNMPFIIDSTVNYLRKNNYNILEVFHPRSHIDDDQRHMVEIAFPHFIIDDITGIPIKTLEKDIEYILKNISLAVADHDNMRGVLLSASDQARSIGQERFKDHEVFEESVMFLHWVLAKNFVFLSTFATDLKGKLERDNLYGIIRCHPEYQDIEQYIALSNPREFTLLKIKKFNDLSLVHRDADMDLVIVKRFDNKSKKHIGYDFFMGFFTTGVYLQSLRTIPLLRLKLTRTMLQYSYDEQNFSSKEFVKALEIFPREEIMQMSIEELYKTAISIVDLTLVPKSRAIVRQGLDDKYYSVILFIPKEKFSTKVKNTIINYICHHYDSALSRHYTHIAEGPLARVHIILKFNNIITNVKSSDIEAELYNLISEWDDKLKDQMLLTHGMEAGNTEYSNAIKMIPRNYKMMVHAKNAVKDLNILKHLDEAHPQIFKLEVINERKGILKVFNFEGAATLSNFIPVLDHMDIFVNNASIYRFAPKNTQDSKEKIKVLSVYNIIPKKASSLFRADLDTRIENLLQDLYSDKLVNDQFNALIVNAHFDGQEARLFRAFAHFLKQVKFPYEVRYIAEVLNKHAAITEGLLRYFYQRFDPKIKRKKENDSAMFNKLLRALDNIDTLSEDQVLRGIMNLIHAIKRTNYFQRDKDGQQKSYISFKVQSAELDSMPKPVPFFEIFVYSKRVEGVHLRGGKVARGGLRMSDRFEDYRTEVLSLMKAQMTKNSIIVPVGSKGGFIVKMRDKCTTKEAVQAESIECYCLFLRGILDLTDNVINGKVVPPKDVVRYDIDDPYLVVAADKGTATFSDYANAISAEYSFWLGDAFASGGSNGYDHKKMGITAKGGWISVMEHLHSLGINMKQDTFTVLGIGDMSGDVFGNGMLLSDNIKLVAAFNHAHIFFDPDPDPKASFKERARLFKLPRSGWDDYSATLISKGGGVYSRSLKSIELTKEVQGLLGTSAKSLMPDQVIHLMLSMSIDMIWNGGIGTYVKSSDETNEQIGDKSNDLLRVNGSQIKAKTIGEGGNLGMTQKGRVEYATQGGKLNTDFIDNSAGVDCSDHEVNIKIAFAPEIHKKKMTLDARNKLLRQLEGEVEELVLADNIAQNILLSIEESRGVKRLQDHEWLMRYLEGNNFLDRELEGLPQPQQITAIKLRKGDKGLTRPEIAVLMGYAKNYIAHLLAGVDFTRNSIYSELLLSYFPKLLQKKYPKMLQKHQLGNEIVHTIFANDIVNKLGVCYFFQIVDEISPNLEDVCLAYNFVCRIFDVNKYWQLIYQSHLDSDTKYKLYRSIQILVGRSVRWTLNHFSNFQDLEDNFAVYYKHYQNLIKHFSSSDNNEVLNLERNNYTEEQLTKNPWVLEVIKMRSMLHALDIISSAMSYNIDLQQVSRKYSELGRSMHINWALNHALLGDSESYLDKVAAKALISRLLDIYGRLVIQQLRHRSHFNILRLQAYEQMVEEMKVSDNISIVTMLSVMVKKLESFLNE